MLLWRLKNIQTKTLKRVMAAESSAFAITGINQILNIKIDHSHFKL